MLNLTLKSSPSSSSSSLLITERRCVEELQCLDEDQKLAIINGTEKAALVFDQTAPQRVRIETRTRGAECGSSKGQGVVVEHSLVFKVRMTRRFPETSPLVTLSESIARTPVGLQSLLIAN